MASGQRRLAAIMFTDMVGYTALGQRNESLSLALVEEQRRLIRPILTRHDGREIKTMGDAFLAEFSSALDAVRCAYDIQRATREFNISLPAAQRIHLRVGVHLGDVVEYQADISGDAVNVASRIEPLAEDGGVCLSRQVYDQVQNKFELQLESLGQMRLKNVSTTMEVYRMVMPWKEERAAKPTELDKKRIAVLPFANMSPDSTDEYFADGLTEELISTMSKVSGLRVIARTSAMRFKGVNRAISEIGSDLGVGSIIEGSIRKQGNKLRVTVQLVETATEEHLWTNSYDRELSDVFVIQSDIAEQVSKALEIRLLEKDAERIRKAETGDLPAYEHYLRGRQLLHDRTEMTLKGAQKEFEGAIAKDPSFARAYSGLADSLFLLAVWGFVPASLALQRAEQAASKAIALDDSLAEAHASAALILERNIDWKGAEIEFRRAISLNPSYATAHHWYATFLADMGRLDEAILEVRRAQEADPLSPTINQAVGSMYYYAGMDEAAWNQWEKVLRLDPNNVTVHHWLSEFLMVKGRAKEAITGAEGAVAADPNNPGNKSVLAAYYAFAGMRSEALKILDELKELSEERTSVSADLNEWLTYIYAGLGDLENYFKHAEKSLQGGFLNLAYLRYSRLMKEVRSDPRYSRLLRKANLA